MNTPFYNPFLAKFLEYASPKMKEPDVWLWIVEDKRAEHIYKIMKNKM